MLLPVGQEDDAAGLLRIAKDLLAQAVELDPEYPDARAFRTIVFNAEGDETATCAELAAFEALDPPPLMADLITDLGVACPGSD